MDTHWESRQTIQKVYRFIARIGEQVDKIQCKLLLWLLEFSRLFPIELPIELVIDDSPIKRYGRKVEGAGRMHDPTNPYCRNATCYGHSLVMVGMIARRPLLGRICLPVGWKFYVNENKLETIDEKIRPQFKTKPEIAAELLKRIVPEIQKPGRKVEILFDRGYLAADLFQVIHELDSVAVTRFKKNNNLYEEPERPAVPRRDRPRKYGRSFKYTDLIARNEGRMQRAAIEALRSRRLGRVLFMRRRKQNDGWTLNQGRSQPTHTQDLKERGSLQRLGTLRFNRP